MWRRSWNRISLTPKFIAPGGWGSEDFALADGDPLTTNTCILSERRDRPSESRLTESCSFHTHPEASIVAAPNGFAGDLMSQGGVRFDGRGAQLTATSQ